MLLALLLVGAMAASGLMSAALATSRTAQDPGGVNRGNVEIDRYMEENWDADLAGGVPYPARTPLMFLHGSWHQMGVQYGEQVGPGIRIVFDAFYSRWLNTDLDPDALPDVIDLFVRETRQLSPEMVQFVRGISQGARSELAESRHADALSDFHKVFFVNALFEVATAPPSLRELMEGTGAQGATAMSTDPEDGFMSHSWAAFGDAITSGGSIAGGTRDQPWFPLLYSAAYVAVPSDPKANVVFGHSIAGTVAASNQVNDQGLFIGNTIVGGTWNPGQGRREQGLGVPALITTAYVSFFADTAREAADQFTVGTELYRRRTGRATLAYTTGFNQLVADPDEALVVERTANRYAVREAGDQGESGPFVVLENHHRADFSFDASATRTDEPMSNFGSGPSGSNYRYWGLFWEITNHLGDIDLEVALDEIGQMKHYYTPEGEKVTEVDGIPAWRLGRTPLRFTIRNPEDPDAFPRGGNLMYVVADLESLDVYYTQGIPDHWSGPWDHVWLGDPAYRALRGGGRG